MVKLNAYKDGVGNIIITEDSFDYLLNSLDNQKYIHEFSFTIREENQKIIDDFNTQCREVQHAKIDIVPSKNYWWLKKRFKNSDVDVMWQLEDVYKIVDILETESMIERNLSTDYYHLTISDNCEYNRQWTVEEIEKINNYINNSKL